MKPWKLMWLALLDHVPVALAYFPLGIVWGILWVQAGFSPMWGIALSCFVYAGAVQFLGITFLAAGEPLLGLVVTALPLAVRNSFYTVAILDRLPTHWLARTYSAFGMVDTTFGILANKPIEQARNPWYAIPLSALIHLSWVAGSIVGLYASGIIPPSVSGLDFALPCLLAILAVDQLRKVKRLAPLFLTGVAVGVAWAVFGQSWLLPALVLCTLFSLIPMPRRQSA